MTSEAGLLMKDKVIVVTGGAGAIAQPIVQRFTAAGAKVLAADRSIDLLKPESGAELVRAAEEKFGGFDGLIHTVGGFAMGKAHEGEPALYDRMFDLNVRTLFYALRAAVPKLVARGDGFIAGFASEPAWTGKAPNSALYGAAKAAVAHLLRSLDAELRGTGVRVAIVYPMGAVDTAANRRDMPDFDPKNYIDPNDIADALLYAASRSDRARVLELPVWPR